jgi:hypothetical protein
VHDPRHHVLTLDYLASVRVPFPEPLPIVPLYPRHHGLLPRIPLQYQCATVTVYLILIFLNSGAKSISVPYVCSLNGSHRFLLSHCDEESSGEEVDSLLAGDKLPKAFDDEALG